MDAGTFIDPKVVAYLKKKFVCVKVNGDDRVLGRYVLTNYRVRAYPTTLVLKADGALKGAIVGYRDAETFIDQMKEVAAAKP